MVSFDFVRSFVGRLAIVAALGWATGCATAPPLRPQDAVEVKPTLDSPHVIRVCLQPPGVPAHQRFWGISSDGSLILEDWALGHLQSHGQSIYYLDPYAAPTSVRMLPIAYNTLQCPEPPPRVAASHRDVVASERGVEAQRADEEREAPEAPAATATAATGATATAATARVTPECKDSVEAGQARQRSTKTYTCTRKRTLKASSRQGQAPVAKAAPQESPSLAQAARASTVPTSPSLTDWSLPTTPNLSGLDPQRVVECVGNLCHARHPNFIKKPANPAAAGTRESRSLSTGGGGGGKPPQTRKPPTGPKPAAAQPGTPVKPKTSDAPKVKEPHRNRVDDRPATRYEKVDRDGKLLKHGVTHHKDPRKRYTKEQIGKGRVDLMERGPRKEMIKKERDLVETNPGPENREPWAGKRKPPQTGGKNE